LILSDASIIREIESGNIIFDPPVSDSAFSPSSVDVHLGDIIQIFKKPHPAEVETLNQRKPIGFLIDRTVDLTHPEIHSSFRELLETIDIPDGGYPLKSQQFVLSYTKEKITLPSHIAARLEGSSTHASFGISIHSTAPTVHPTFTGVLVLEISNSGELPCLLKKGMAIGQLVFEYMDSPPIKTLQSVWQGQRPPR